MMTLHPAAFTRMLCSPEGFTVEGDVSPAAFTRMLCSPEGFTVEGDDSSSIHQDVLQSSRT